MNNKEELNKKGDFIIQNIVLALIVGLISSLWYAYFAKNFQNRTLNFSVNDLIFIGSIIAVISFSLQAIALKFIGKNLIYIKFWYNPSTKDNDKIIDHTLKAIISELQFIPEDERAKTAKLGAKANSLGIVSIEQEWQSFYLDGTIRRRLKEDTIHVKTRPVTWYFITVNPEGFKEWSNQVIESVNSGVNVEWVYQAPETLDINNKAFDPAIKKFWEMHVWQGDDIKSYNLEEQIKTLRGYVLRSKRPEIWKVYKSFVPHVFLGFLSVPDTPKEKEYEAPDGTYGIVNPYGFFPTRESGRYGLYLEKGHILNYYYQSTLKLFKQGVKVEHKYLEKDEVKS